MQIKITKLLLVSPPRAAVAMLLALAATVVSVAVAVGPCDILGAAGNPCVAAHSTVRALYAAYGGPLYNVSALPFAVVAFADLSLA